MNAVIKWFTRPAKWWQFWRPQSGPVGGVILTALVMSVSFMFFTWVFSL